LFAVLGTVGTMDDGRARLLSELALYTPADAREAAMAAALTAFVSANVACFERTLLIGHLTASAWVVDETYTHALLTHHRKLGKWLQLGGHADGESDVRRAALREATEESGLATLRFAHHAIYDIDVHPIPARGAEPAHHHYDVRFAFIADRNAPLVVSEESHALAWRPIAQLDVADIDESVRRLARKTAGLQVIVTR
jgi:8-oxo-dGTP pyrophosphatase MutT (NUDIX family)